jgi:hypothetical protein
MIEVEVDEDLGEVRPRPRNASAQCGGAVYGLGLLGALVWFWRQADGVGAHVTSVLKAFVWPAVLVYRAFKALG